MDAELKIKLNFVYHYLNNNSFDLNLIRESIISLLNQFEIYDYERERFTFELSRKIDRNYLNAVSRIHDGPLQVLDNSIKIYKSDLLDYSELEKFRQETLALIEKVEEAVKQIRLTIMGTEPECLIKTDLVVDLRRTIRYPDILVDLKIDGEVYLNNVSSTFSKFICQFVERTLMNSIEHGDAKNARVIVLGKQSGLIITVEDNGHGFEEKFINNEDILLELAEKGHIGLRLSSLDAKGFNGKITLGKSNDLGGALVRLEADLPC